MDAVGISGGDDDHKGHHSAASSGDFETSSDDDESKEPSPEPIVIELTAEELAALEAERVRREKEEAEKRAVNEVAYRKVLHSKLVMESVELCKRTGERLNWVLFTPNRSGTARKSKRERIQSLSANCGALRESAI